MTSRRRIWSAPRSVQRGRSSASSSAALRGTKVWLTIDAVAVDDEDVPDAADLPELIDQGLDRRRVAGQDQLVAGVGDRRRDGGALLRNSLDSRVHSV